MGQKMRELLAEQAGQERPYFAIDAINLTESGLAALCDTTVAVLAPKALRLASWPATASQKTMPAAALRPKSRTNFTALPAVLCWKTAARRKHSNKPVNNGSKP